MNLDTSRYLASRITALEQENAVSTIDLEMARMKVSEIERRMTRTTQIIEGLKPLIGAAK